MDDAFERIMIVLLSLPFSLRSFFFGLLSFAGNDSI